MSGPPGLPIVVEVDYAVDDLVEFQEHLQKRLNGWLRWVSWVILGGVVTLMALLMLLVALSPADQSGSVRSGMMAGFKATGPWVAIFVVFFVLTMRRTRRAVRDAFARPSNMHRHHQFAIDAGGVAVREPLFWGHYAWPAILRWAETPRLFVLHYADFSALIIPKRFAAGREEELRTMLRTFVDQRAVVPVPAQPSPGGSMSGGPMSGGPPPLPV